MLRPVAQTQSEKSNILIEDIKEEEISKDITIKFNDQECFLLYKIINREKVINNFLPIEKKYVHKEDSEQIVISDVRTLEKTQLSNNFFYKGIENIFYCEAKPNLKCPVCFDHPLDHYPLMMIFEIGRQLAIATSHKFHNIPFEGYMCIVNSLSFQFKSFCELDKPLMIVCIDKDVDNKKTTLKRDLNFLFLQEGILCSTGTGSMTVFKRKLYEKIRILSRGKIVEDKNQSKILTNIDLLVHRKKLS